MLCTQVFSLFFFIPLPPLRQHFTQPRLSGTHTVEDDTVPLTLPSAEITGVHHHAWFILFRRWNPGPCAGLASSLPTDPHLEDKWGLWMEGGSQEGSKILPSRPQ